VSKAQLRVRTEYSFGETFAPVARLVARLKAMGCPAAAIADNDSTWGHVAWHKACRAAGIKPILGVSLIVSNEADEMPRMTLLARNAAGLKELYQTASNAYTQKISTKRGSFPRLFRADIVALSDNILVLAGDVTDEDFLRKARAVLDMAPGSRVLNEKKRGIAARLGVPLVSVSDNYYTEASDRQVFELVVDGGLKPSPQHLLDEVDDAGLADRFEDYDLAVAPSITVPGDLRAMCLEGIEFRARENGLKWSSIYQQRMDYELDLIISKEFASYFIVVADMVHFAKKHMLVGPSRGSAAGSLVCYLTRITEIDPIEHDLYFERFIDVTRKDLPDIDLDFPDTKRHMVFEYMAEKYGKSNVAHIGTISTFKPKSALIQVCKRLGIPAAATFGVKTAMIERSIADSRANNCLQDTLETTEPGKELVAMYPSVTLACGLEGHASHTGVHAAGLLAAPIDLRDFCTITDMGIAQIEKGAAEKLGLLKIDVLGLRTLGILEDSGVPADWYRMTFDDPEVYRIFNEQRLCAIFQFEGQALRALSREIEFKTLVEIDAITALARPGPFGGGITQEYLERANGKKYEPIHPLVEQAMAETFGLPLYQEQTLAIVRTIGRFNWDDTTFVRKAIAKRMGKEFFDTQWVKFRDGAASQDINEEQARRTWEMINSMGAWQMNKAHTRSYAVISYWTAWLKRYHPLEFAAANLRNAKDEDSAIALLREMSKEGIDYVRFDPDLSEETWSVKDGRLIAGFTALHGFGPVKAKKFVAARAEGKLTPAMREQALKAKNVFADIFPIETKYKALYDDPRGNHIVGPVARIGAITGHEDAEVVFIGKLIHKGLRDINEEVLLKRRHGKRMHGPSAMVDMRLEDDTGDVLVRVNRFDYAQIGREIIERVPIGSMLLVRAKFGRGIRFGFVSKWKRI